MVTKIWNSCCPQQAQVYRHNFYLCQWQRNTQVKIIYLLYRWLSAILFLAVLACSMLDIGRAEQQIFEQHYAKWWIYITHWGLMACTLQSWLGAWIVTNGMMVDRDEFELQRHSNTSRFHKAYWILYTIATVYSFIITMSYWTVVHNSEVDKIDAVNIMVHVVNSVMMLIDLAIVGMPIKLSHAYFTAGIGAIYTIFSGIYYLAGGTNRKNSICIYPLLDWSRPGKSIVISACAILFVFVVHFLVYCLYRLRVCIYTKACLRKQKGAQDKMTAIGKTISSLEEAQRENFLNPSTIVDLKL